MYNFLIIKPYLNFRGMVAFPNLSGNTATGNHIASKASKVDWRSDIYTSPSEHVNSLDARLLGCWCVGDNSGVLEENQ